MTGMKARALESILGGEVVRIMPQSRMPGVRLTLADGRVTLIDEYGGETYRNAAAVDAYAYEGDERA